MKGVLFICAIILSICDYGQASSSAVASLSSDDYFYISMYLFGCSFQQKLYNTYVAIIMLVV